MLCLTRPPASRGRGGRLARFAEFSQTLRRPGARHRARDARSVPSSRAYSRPRGHRRGWRHRLYRAPQRNYASRVRLSGEFHEKTLISALNLSITLVRANKACESMAFSRPLLPMSRRALGADHEITLRFAHSYAYAACNCAAASRDEVVFAEKLLEDTIRRFRRVLGTAHPSTSKAEGDLFYLRERLANL